MRWLCYRSYPTAKLYYRLLLRFAHARGGVPILVYQMGKVASQTIAETLVRLDLPSPVFHLHVLSQQLLEEDERRYRTNWTKDGTPAHLWTSQHVRRRLEADPESRWRIVTLVRDPIARNVSMFFQTTHRWLALDPQRARYAEDPDSLMEELRERFFEHFAGHDFPDTWFDSELRRFFGIDVYEEPFGTSRGYQIYANDKVQVLVIRAEDLRACASAAFRDFLGVDVHELRDVNVSDEKSYASVYRRFVETVNLPATYLARMYGSRYARHFYTQEELDAFRRRWTARQLVS